MSLKSSHLATRDVELSFVLRVSVSETFEAPCIGSGSAYEVAASGTLIVCEEPPLTRVKVVRVMATDFFSLLDVKFYGRLHHRICGNRTNRNDLEVPLLSGCDRLPMRVILTTLLIRAIAGDGAG